MKRFSAVLRGCSISVFTSNSSLGQSVEAALCCQFWKKRRGYLKGVRRVSSAVLMDSCFALSLQPMGRNIIGKICPKQVLQLGGLQKQKHTRKQKRVFGHQTPRHSWELSASKPAEVFELLLKQWHPQLVFCCVMVRSGVARQQHGSVQRAPTSTGDEHFRLFLTKVVTICSSVGKAGERLGMGMDAGFENKGEKYGCGETNAQLNSAAPIKPEKPDKQACKTIPCPKLCQRCVYYCCDPLLFRLIFHCALMDLKQEQIIF